MPIIPAGFGGRVVEAGRWACEGGLYKKGALWL